MSKYRTRHANMLVARRATTSITSCPNASVGHPHWVPATSYPARCAGDALGGSTRERRVSPRHARMPAKRVGHSYRPPRHARMPLSGIHTVGSRQKHAGTTYLPTSCPNAFVGHPYWVPANSMRERRVSLRHARMPLSGIHTGFPLQARGNDTAPLVMPITVSSHHTNPATPDSSSQSVESSRRDSTSSTASRVQSRLMPYRPLHTRLGNAHRVVW